MYKYVIVSYFIINLLIGFFSKNKNDDAQNYFFLSRKLTLPGFIASIVSGYLVINILFAIIARGKFHLFSLYCIFLSFLSFYVIK